MRRQSGQVWKCLEDAWRRWTLYGAMTHGSVGSAVSLADLYAYPMIALLRLAGEGDKVFHSHPGLVDWYSRFGERDSAKVTRHRMEPEESD
jgi:glutathione S-transferase